jgi:hypothetical protein
MTFEDLLPPVTDLGVDIDVALSTWRWLIGTDVTPLLLTALGDLFLERDGAIFFLNTCTGTFERVSGSRREWKEMLRDLEYLQRWFQPDLVMALRNERHVLKPGEVHSPLTPQVLGGNRTPENYTSSQWRMHLHFLGQVHEQVRRMPPGTRIEELRFEPFS